MLWTVNGEAALTVFERSVRTNARVDTEIGVLRHPVKYWNIVLRYPSMPP